LNILFLTCPYLYILVLTEAVAVADPHDDTNHIDGLMLGTENVPFSTAHTPVEPPTEETASPAVPPSPIVARQSMEG
jgi:hypothetical protein